MTDKQKEFHCCDECANPDCGMVGHEMTIACDDFVWIWAQPVHRDTVTDGKIGKLSKPSMG